MGGRLRTLIEADCDEVVQLLARRPDENLFLASKIHDFGIDRRRVGKLLGFERDGKLTAVCLEGGTIFPTGEDPEAIPAFVEAIGRMRRASSIVGPSMSALGVYLGLSQRWPASWGNVNNIRNRQPVMRLDSAPKQAADPRVQQLGVGHFESYHAASIAMYTEEIGSSPYRYGPGYEAFTKARLISGDAYGVVSDGEVIFKADIGTQQGAQAQLQGVWLQPQLRGQRQSVALLAGALELMQRRFPVISLYVNDFNLPALRAYERLGFETVGYLSTVHY